MTNDKIPRALSTTTAATMTDTNAPRQDCGRWTLAFAFVVVFGSLCLYHSMEFLPFSRIMSLDNVSMKRTSLRGDVMDDSGRISSNFTSVGQAFEGDAQSDDVTDSTAKNNASGQNNDFTLTKQPETSVNSTKDSENAFDFSHQVMDAYSEFMKDCTSASCRAHVQQHKERWGGDLLNLADVRTLVNQARDELIAQLKVDYGEDNFVNIFTVNGTSQGRQAFVSANVEEGQSIERFKRKLKMKILEMQATIRAERESLKESSRRRVLAAPDFYQRFVWATGGHSASAGHGNIFNESYTSVMNRAVTDVFGSIGIEFVGRSNAMGGTASAPEIALCSEAIFGTDIDIQSWDYGMTDANWFFRKAMYNQRAGLNPNRPAIIDLNGGGRDFKIRNWINRRTEERGLTSIYLDPDQFDSMEEMFPDTFGLSKEDVDAMPRFVRHYKCSGSIEKGDPTCGEYKYSNLEICPKRKGMASWHPGWKRMALWGNLLALFLSDMLLDSVEELGLSIVDPLELLAKLRKEEDADYERFETSFAPDDLEYHLVPIDNDLVDEKNVSYFFRSPSFCHTARLPAETRHLGYVTESNQVGVRDFEYFKGIPMSEAMRMTKGNTTESTMPLVYDENDREHCDEAEIKRDYMDFFLVTDQMGPRTLTIPNKAERQAYGRESESLQGIIVLCSIPCPFGKCPKGELELDAIQNGTIQMDINGQSVTNTTNFAGCSVLRGKNSHRWQPNEAGQFVLKASVSESQNTTLSFFRISSLVLL